MLVCVCMCVDGVSLCVCGVYVQLLRLRVCVLCAYACVCKCVYILLCPIIYGKACACADLPNFSQHFSFIKDIFDVLDVTVFDEDMGGKKKEFLGSISIPLLNVSDQQVLLHA